MNNLGANLGMVRIEKRYFTLRETAERWEVAMEDLGYLAENGDLRVSTRLEGAHLERGTIEVEHGQEFRIPHEQAWFSGVIDLQRRDAYRIFREGRAEVVHFHAEGDEYAAVIDPTPTVVVRLKHLVVRRDERDRVEALHERAGHTVAEGIGFQHSPDYRNVRLGTTEITLGAVQAQVARLLHQAALSDAPWCDGKTILSEAGATSMRMSDVFKSQKQWRQLIRLDGRGRYQLRLKPE
jgi:hypothetical protein